jgi:hypothetical protein
MRVVDYGSAQAFDAAEVRVRVRLRVRVRVRVSSA